MAKARVSWVLVAGCLVFGAGQALAASPPTVAQMLSWYKPKQAGVACTTPTPEEQKSCRVEPVAGARQGSSNGWQLRDAQGRLLRRFFDNNGDKKRDNEKQINVYSFYKDGVEVYREIDTKYTGKTDQYRWLNAGGMKWGLDLDGDGKIDYWMMISPEEACQELFQALAGNDLGRFKALLLREAEIKTLKLLAAEEDRLKNLVNKAAARFQTIAGKLPAKAEYGGMEAAPPQCTTADSLGGGQDLFKYLSRTIRYDHGDKQHDWLQSGEMLQIGKAWRLVEGPALGDGSADEAKSKAGTDPELEKLLKDLADVDAHAPQPGSKPGPNTAVCRYNKDRAALIERILAKVKAEEQDQWTRQLADALGTAAQSSPANDNSSLEQLGRLRAKVAGAAPGSALAAYVAFREMWAEYAPELAKGGPQFAKVQERWLEQLKKFVTSYPSAEDTPDALLQLAMGSEFKGKDGESEAKKWYEQLAKFQGNPLAAKAQGAKRRLELEGKTMELSGTTLTGEAFNLTRLRGKVVVVYYWASYCEQLPGDFAKLKLLVSNQGKKGVDVVGVNLDDNKDDAVKYLKDNAIPAVHLYQAGGLNSPLATQYGIMGLPNLFLVGKDGKVVSRTVPINDLEDEVKKLLAK
jgi:thiol-disulfide isomerase/thioredoxin